MKQNQKPGDWTLITLVYSPVAGGAWEMREVLPERDQGARPGLELSQPWPGLRGSSLHSHTPIHTCTHTQTLLPPTRARLQCRKAAMSHCGMSKSSLQTCSPHCANASRCRSGTQTRSMMWPLAPTSLTCARFPTMETKVSSKRSIMCVGGRMEGALKGRTK